MVDLNKLSRPALGAAMRGGTAGWGRIGSATEHLRYIQAIKSRRKCRCGCGGRTTQAGMANGLALTSGCELYVRRWVRDGIGAVRAQQSEGKS
jgi:hypothetical protein